MSSGSPEVLSLRPKQALEDVKSVELVMVLAKRGLSLLKAKRSVERMLDEGRAVLELPKVEDASALVRDLEASGCAVAFMKASREVDVASLRRRLGLTREQFALQFGLDVETVRNWESRRRVPDLAAASYLRVIESIPAHVSVALENNSVSGTKRTREHEVEDGIDFSPW